MEFWMLYSTLIFIVFINYKNKKERATLLNPSFYPDNREARWVCSPIMIEPEGTECRVTIGGTRTFLYYNPTARYIHKVPIILHDLTALLQPAMW